MDYQGRLGWGPHARKRGRTEHAYAPIGARERGGPCSMLYASIDKLVAHFIFLLVALHVFVPVLMQTCKVKSCTRKNRSSSSFRVLCLACAHPPPSPAPPGSFGASLARAVRLLRAFIFNP